MVTRRDIPQNHRANTGRTVSEFGCVSDGSAHIMMLVLMNGLLVEPAFITLPDLNRDGVDKGMEEKIQQLKETLHFKKARIEVEEKWILKVEVNW